MKSLVLILLLFTTLVKANEYRHLPIPVVNALRAAEQGLADQYGREFEVRYHRQEPDQVPISWLLQHQPNQEKRWQLIMGNDGKPSDAELREADRRWNRRRGSNEDGQIELDLSNTEIVERAELWQIKLGLRLIRNGRVEERLSDAIEAYAWFDPSQQMITRLQAQSIEPFRIYVLSVQHFELEMSFKRHDNNIVTAHLDQEVQARALLWSWNQRTSYEYLY